MKKFALSVATLSLLLVACGNNTEGLSPDSSRQPKGNLNAAVTVTEYADLQCPACRAAHTQIVAPLMEKYGNQIKYEFMHFPIRSIHRHALEAAMAAECAADQGKFWEFIDIAFEKQDQMSMEAILAWGGELGLDTELYERCWKSQIKKDTVIANYKQGRENDVGGTPTFFVNGERVDTGLAEISAAIEEAQGNFKQKL